MSETKTCVEKPTSHTPGPWTTRATGIPGSVEIRDSQKRWLATTYSVDYPDHPVTPGEAESDARLMAAAPELLQTLEDILQGLADGEDDLDLGVQIRNAIRKARGEV